MRGPRGGVASRSGSVSRVSRSSFGAFPSRRPWAERPDGRRAESVVELGPTLARPLSPPQLTRRRPPVVVRTECRVWGDGPRDAGRTLTHTAVVVLQTVHLRTARATRLWRQTPLLSPMPPPWARALTAAVPCLRSWLPPRLPAPACARHLCSQPTSLHRWLLTWARGSADRFCRPLPPPDGFAVARQQWFPSVRSVANGPGAKPSGACSSS